MLQLLDHVVLLTEPGSFPAICSIVQLTNWRYLWVLTFTLEDCSVFGNFVITLIEWIHDNISTIIWLKYVIKLFALKLVGAFLCYNCPKLTVIILYVVSLLS